MSETGEMRLPYVVEATTATQWLAQLPRPVFGAIGAIVLSAFLVRICPKDFAWMLFAQLPIQIYWFSCIAKLNWATAVLDDGRPAMSYAELAFVGIASCVFMPIFAGFPLRSHWLDPSFWPWVATQMYWPVRFGMFLQNQEQGNKNGILPVILAILGGGYTVLGMFFAPVLEVQLFFNGAWFASQFACLTFVKESVKESLLLKNKDVTLPTLAARTKVSSDIDGEVVVPYRCHAAVERWIYDRLHGQQLTKNARLIVTWVVSPILLLGTLIALIYAAYVLRDAQPVATGVQTVATGAAVAAAGATTAATASYIGAFIKTILLIGGAGTVAYLLPPTHLGVSSHGVRWLWRRKFFTRNGVLVGWRQIGHIGVLPRGRGGKSSQSPRQDLVFGSTTAGGPPGMKVKLESLTSIDDREDLLKAIDEYGHASGRDPEVMRVLERPADQSYTELWLQALAAPPKRERLKPLTPGHTLRNGTYEVECSLGVGGQGQAYLAHDNTSGQSIVLKEFILPVFVDVNVRRDALQQFEQEAKILKQLDSPLIVKLLDFFVEDHRAYLVLEHIDGASLRQICKSKGPLQESQVRMLAGQMCQILAYLHDLSPPVVHRDFTPDNLLLNTDGQLKLIDFTVAKQSVESRTAGTVVGKHAYLPPEQFRGMPVPASDIYALGATLYFLLVGSDPEPISVADPSLMRADVSAGMAAICRQATALDLSKRYQSVRDLERDLG